MLSNKRTDRKDPIRLPTLYVLARIDWADLHEYGGQIGAKMLSPLHGRAARKRFKAQRGHWLDSNAATAKLRARAPQTRHGHTHCRAGAARVHQKRARMLQSSMSHFYSACGRNCGR